MCSSDLPRKTWFFDLISDPNPFLLNATPPSPQAHLQGMTVGSDNHVVKTNSFVLTSPPLAPFSFVKRQPSLPWRRHMKPGFD